MVKAPPTPALAVSEPQVLLHVLIVALDTNQLPHAVDLTVRQLTHPTVVPVGHDVLTQKQEYLASQLHRIDRCQVLQRKDVRIWRGVVDPREVSSEILDRLAADYLVDRIEHRFEVAPESWQEPSRMRIRHELLRYVFGASPPDEGTAAPPSRI